MTQNRRIVLNIVATYGRSLFAMLCGIFTSRWVLMSLGQQDYGLYGLIGGLTMFVTFINGTMAAAVSRYYTVSIGKAQIAEDKGSGLEECRRWFTLAVFLHAVIPTILIVFGYPSGAWAIENFLAIPPGRVDACIWVFRFVSLSSFVSMINVPYMALYIAKQYIAELTIYSFVTTIANMAIVFFMVTHSGDWLARYAFAMCLTSVIPQLIICLRARHVFPECCFRLDYCFDWLRMKRLFLFAWWQMFGTISMLLRCEALSIITNKAFGPRYNSSMSLATVVNSQCGTLSAAMLGAFSPAIMTAYGAGDYERAQSLSHRACKFGAIFFLLFALPLILEMDYVLKLWLVEPPPFCATVCMLVLTGTILEQMVAGTNSIVNASGRIQAYQVMTGVALLLTIPVALGLVYFTRAFVSMPLTILIVAFLFVVARVYCARRAVGFSLRYWLRNVVLPVGSISAIGILIGGVIIRTIPPSFFRLVVTTGVTILSMVMLLWWIILDKGEKDFISMKLTAFKVRIMG